MGCDQSRACERENTEQQQLNERESGIQDQKYHCETSMVRNSDTPAAAHVDYESMKPGKLQRLGREGGLAADLSPSELIRELRKNDDLYSLSDAELFRCCPCLSIYPHTVVHYSPLHILPSVPPTSLHKLGSIMQYCYYTMPNCVHVDRIANDRGLPNDQADDMERRDVIGWLVEAPPHPAVITGAPPDYGVVDGIVVDTTRKLETVAAPSKAVEACQHEEQQPPLALEQQQPAAAEDTGVGGGTFASLPHETEELTESPGRPQRAASEVATDKQISRAEQVETTAAKDQMSIIENVKLKTQALAEKEEPDAASETNQDIWLDNDVLSDDDSVDGWMEMNADVDETQLENADVDETQLEERLQQNEQLFLEQQRKPAAACAAGQEEELNNNKRQRQSCGSPEANTSRRQNFRTQRRRTISGTHPRQRRKTLEFPEGLDLDAAQQARSEEQESLDAAALLIADLNAKAAGLDEQQLLEQMNATLLSLQEQMLQTNGTRKRALKKQQGHLNALVADSTNMYVSRRDSDDMCVQCNETELAGAPRVETVSGQHLNETHDTACAQSEVAIEGITPSTQDGGVSAANDISEVAETESMQGSRKTSAFTSEPKGICGLCNLIVLSSAERVKTVDGGYCHKDCHSGWVAKQEMALTISSATLDALCAGTTVSSATLGAVGAGTIGEVKGICTHCNKPVLQTHPRVKNQKGYMHQYCLDTLMLYSSMRR